MSTTVRNLDSILPESMKGDLSRFVKDCFGVPLTFHGVKFSHDERGDKASFLCSEIGQDKKFTVATRASQPVQLGVYCFKNKLFPFNAKFIPQGQAVVLVDPDTPYEPGEAEYIPS